MFVGQNKLLFPGYIQSFEQQIQALDAAGNIRWMGLAEVIDSWETEYGSEPNIFSYLTSGTIAGSVHDPDGIPIAGAQVRIYGADAYSDTTDAAGAYALPDVPVAAPRYILVASADGYQTAQTGAAPRYILVASADGYQTAQTGDVDVAGGLTTTVNFTLTAGSPTSDTLEVRLGYLVHREPGPLLDPPPGALISPTLYPTNVLPYLEPGRYIESDDPDIVALAQSILDTVTPTHRTDSTAVAHAVYVWVVQNIEYDLTSNYPGDVTCGNWQTTNGGWGHSFADWAYTAREVLEEGRSICIENERLTSALLRALDIPARPAPLMAHPVTQWWVQQPDGSGFWANMDTARGRNAYVNSGKLWAFFPAAEEHTIGFWSPDADAPIHVDWWTDEPALWWEHYGGRRYYTDTAAGLAQAQADLATFVATGNPPPGGPPLDESHYWLVSRGFGVDLTNVGLQSSFVVSFALPAEAVTYTELLSVTHWTNHSDWVVDTYTTTQSNAETGESLTWYVLEMQRYHQVYLPLILR
jgi:transglutaminase-like putative cysteine protease